MNTDERVIKAATDSRTIIFALLAASTGNVSCEEYYRTNKGRKSLDISFITDDRVAETIVRAVHELFKGVATGSYVRDIISLGFIRLFETEPDMFGMDYPGFFQAVSEMDLKSGEKHLKRAKRLIYKSCEYVSCSGDMFKCDCWDLRDLTVSPDRINPTASINTLNFSGVRDESNKQLLKRYMKHLLFDTQEALSTIKNKFNVLRAILNTESVPFINWGQLEAERAVAYLKDKYSKRSAVKGIFCVERFSQYYVELDVIPENQILPLHYLVLGSQYEFRETNRDSYVISEIFSVLNGINHPYLKIWFLLIFTTGMRSSEACAIRRDCLEADTNGRYYIRFYSQKMKKYVTNRIPESLYEMIAHHVKSLPMECEYLFPSPIKTGQPLTSVSMSQALNREFKRLGVKNADGTPYIFRAHDLRHWIAKRMYEEDIPVQFIQEQLHHVSPEMTVAYIEFEDKAKARKMKQYFRDHKDKMPAPQQNTVVNDWDYADYARKKISLQALPNGMCARPKVLGKCSNANSCLFCSDFRTSLKDLPGHREHLKNLNSFISSAEKYGWEEQAEDSKKIKKRLVEIIRKLEEMEAEYE